MGVIDPIVYKPNRQLEAQRWYQSQWQKPIYMRHKNARFYIPLYGAVFTFGIGYSLLAISDLVLGRNKKELA